MRCPSCWRSEYRREPFTLTTCWAVLLMSRPVRCRTCNRILIRPFWTPARRH